MRWRSPARCLPRGRCRASAKKFDKKGTAVVTYDSAKVSVAQMVAAVKTLGYTATSLR